jgi:hypothetical protein
VDAAGAVAEKQIEKRYRLKGTSTTDMSAVGVDAISGGYEEREIKDARVYAGRLLAKLGSAVKIDKSANLQRA